VLSGGFIAEEVDGVREKVSGDTTTADVQTHLEAFLNLSVRSTCFTDEAFYWQKAKLLVLGIINYSELSKFPNYQMLDQRNFAVQNI
jgi:hypothetical protein